VIDTMAATLALRGRALALSVCTTGSTTLSATSTGFARASGSFVTDGFQVGMELLASGFSAANNGYAVVESVSALALKIAGGRSVQAAAGSRTLTVGLPEGRSWENTEYTPTAGRPYVEEDMVPATSRLWTFPSDGGQLEETGLYVIRWYGLAGRGIGGLRRSVDALKARFAAGTPIAMDAGTLRVRADLGPFAGAVRQIDGGWALCTVTVPWLARSQNAVV